MFVEVKPRTVFFLQTLYFTAFIAKVEKIITNALGEHDPGSAQDWRTSNDFCSPGCCYCYIAAAFSWLSCAAADAVNSADLSVCDARNAF